MTTAARITHLLHSRTLARIMPVLACAAVAVAWIAGDVVPIPGNKGLGFPSPNEWLAGRGVLSPTAGMAMLGGALLLIEFTNKVFNVLRSMTALPVTLACVMLASTPLLSGQLYTGSLLALTMWVLIPLMFSTYGTPGGMQRRVFLMFFILGLGGLCQYAFLLYIPMLMTACAQMKIFNLRTLLAACIGLITPLWTVLGFGILHPADLTLPRFVSVFSSFDSGNTVTTLTAIGVTAAAAILFISLNLLKFIAYNARVRSYNGMLTLMTIWTLLLMCIDFTNIIIYQPLLVTLTSCQTAHYFSRHRQGRSYIALLGIIAVYTAIYIWNIMK